jgi:hypothetical protein
MPVIAAMAHAGRGFKTGANMRFRVRLAKRAGHPIREASRDKFERYGVGLIQLSCVSSIIDMERATDLRELGRDPVLHDEALAWLRGKTRIMESHDGGGDHDPGCHGGLGDRDFTRMAHVDDWRTC